ncbi:hypothetical protein SCARR_01932 [Pontiella sulfatireligans]|uniref:Uncharacterized protein n=1 Tax=Pontiella sulfatireligans TaxID=2750658 RepID=A0A6C2UI26_9BACT|nr:hypothetical protein SCARR_01932 [Pontiella sulfatireligans]
MLGRKECRRVHLAALRSIKEFRLAAKERMEHKTWNEIAS